MKRNKTIHNSDYTKLIERLVLERKRLGLSQAEVAAAVDMTQSDISKIETLERRLDVLEFKLLLQAYRVSENKSVSQTVVGFLNLET